MAKNDANKEGPFLGPKGPSLTTVSILNNTVVTGGKRPVAEDGRTRPYPWNVPYPGEVRTGKVRSVSNSKVR